MKKKKIEMSKALKKGWEVVKANWKEIVLFTLVAMIVRSVPGAVANWVDRIGILAFLLRAIGWVVGLWVEMRLIQAALSWHKGSMVKVSFLWDDMEKDKQQFIQFMIASVVFGILVMIGMVLLVVPGVILALMMGMYAFLVVEKNMKGIDALKASKELTKGARWQLLGFGLLLLLLNMLGAVALLVGLLVTMPMSMVAGVEVYKQLSKGGVASAAHKNIEDDLVPEVG